jgi:hypothetical protein
MHPAMLAEIAAYQIRDMQAEAARDQRAGLARRGRRAARRTAAAAAATDLIAAAPSRNAARELTGHHA